MFKFVFVAISLRAAARLASPEEIGPKGISLEIGAEALVFKERLEWRGCARERASGGLDEADQNAGANTGLAN